MKSKCQKPSPYLSITSLIPIRESGTHAGRWWWWWCCILDPIPSNGLEYGRKHGFTALRWNW